MIGKVLITGGLGNLGSWLTRHFINSGYQVWVLTKNKRQLTIDLPYQLIECDITSLEECKQNLDGKDFELVVHTASVNDGFVDNYFELANRVNVLGTRNLLEVLKNNPVKHFLYFSTFQVYGKYSGTIDEHTPTEPKNDYGATHLFAEYHIRQFHLNTSLPFTIVRLTNSYGCPLDHNSSKWYLILNDLARSAFRDQQIVLKSNGKSQRDFIWMGDVAQVIQKLLESPATNEIYNLSGEKTFNMLDIAEKVHAAYMSKYGRKIGISVNQQDLNEYPHDLMVSSSKLRELVKIEDKVCFESEAKKIFDLLEKGEHKE